MLVTAFNQMLDRIQERDAALQNSNNQLESRVEERTRQLQAEVDERNLAEETLSKERGHAARADRQRAGLYVRQRRAQAASWWRTRPWRDTWERKIRKSCFKRPTSISIPRSWPTSFSTASRNSCVPNKRCSITKTRSPTGQGDKMWLLTTKVPLFDKAGQVTGLAGVGRDITERQKVEREAHRSQGCR